MAFFFSQESREQRAREKELEQQRKREKEERLLKESKEYCIWYSNETRRFIDELKTKNFNPSWGFEVEPERDILQGTGGIICGKKYVFDIPKVEGIAFDNVSKQLLYFTCSTGYYEKYKDSNTHLKYDYVLIPFKDIFKATVEVDSETTISTVSSKQGVVGRSIVGGLLAGEVGAIIGGTTSKENSISKTEVIPKKIAFNIQTIHPKYPIISFEFEKAPWESKASEGNKSISDIMYDIFSGEKELASVLIFNLERKCDTDTDLRYGRIHGWVDYQKIRDDMNSSYYKEYSSKTSDLEKILLRINRYVMQIESIIQQCNVENNNDSETGMDIVGELTKLADLKAKGIITEEEFSRLKAKLI